MDVEGNTPLHVAVEVPEGCNGCRGGPGEAPRNEIATVSCLLEQMAGSLKHPKDSKGKTRGQSQCAELSWRNATALCHTLSSRST